MKYTLLLISLFIFCFSFSQTWESVGSGLSGGDSVYGIVQHGDINALCVFRNKLYAGGNFLNAGKRYVNSLACWNGKAWDTVSTGIDGFVYGLNIYQNNLCVMGCFAKHIQKRIYAENIALWNDSTGNWSEVEPLNYLITKPRLNTSSYSFICTSIAYNNKLYVGGCFALGGSYNISVWDGIKFNPVGKERKKLELASGEGAGIGGPLVGAIINYKGQLLIGGQFENTDGLHSNNVVRWDDTTWKLVGKPPPPGGIFIGQSGTYIPNEGILCFAAYNGELYAGGFNCGRIGGYQVGNNIAKWNDTIWSAVGEGVHGSVYAMVVFNNKLYVGGCFDSAGGKPANNIAMWDGKT